MPVKLLSEHHLEFLSLKGGCTGSSEFTIVKMQHCWKPHVTAHFLSCIQVSKRTLASTVFQKITFLRFFRFNYALIRIKLDLAVKCVKVNLRLSFEQTWCASHSATQKGLKSSAFWFCQSRELEGFYHIWTWWSSWLYDQDQYVWKDGQTNVNILQCVYFFFFKKCSYTNQHFVSNFGTQTTQ